MNNIFGFGPGDGEDSESDYFKDDPGHTDSDYQGEKDSGTFTKVDYDLETGRTDTYYGERGSSDHGHIVINSNGHTVYLRDDDGKVHRDE